jgi:hypothetical protein
MSSEVGASSFMSDMSVRDALNEQPAPAAAPPLVVEIERDTVEDEDTLLGGLEIIPPSSFWTDNKQASFAVNNRLLKCKRKLKLFIALKYTPKSHNYFPPLHVSLA